MANTGSFAYIHNMICNAKIKMPLTLPNQMRNSIEMVLAKNSVNIMTIIAAHPSKIE